MAEKKKNKAPQIVCGCIVLAAIVATSAYAIKNFKNPINLNSTTEIPTLDPNQTTMAGDYRDAYGSYDLFDTTQAPDFNQLPIEEEEEFVLDDQEDTQNFQQGDWNNATYDNSPVYQNTKSSYQTTTAPHKAQTEHTTPVYEKTTTTTAASTTAPAKTKKDTGVWGYWFNKDQKYFFTSKDSWQRSFGFSKVYDDFAPVIQFFYDTERFKFTYGQYDWMIQLWKGQYGYVMIGSEIGVYTRPKGSNVDFYDCAKDEDCLKMKMKLLRKNSEVLFDRPEGYYWWMTGFVPGTLDRFSDRSELQMIATITFKDATMRNLALAAMKENGFVEKSKWVEPKLEYGKKFTGKKYYTVSGNSISFTWQ